MKDAEMWRNVASEIVTKGRLDLIDEYFAQNYVDHEPPPPGVTADREGVRTLFASMKEAFPDLKAEVLHQSQDGNTHYGHIRMTGTMKGDFMGMPATNKKASWEEMHIGVIRDGKILEHWGVQDQLGMLQQLGFAPPPGQAGSNR